MRGACPRAMAIPSGTYESDRPLVVSWIEWSVFFGYASVCGASRFDPAGIVLLGLRASFYLRAAFFNL